VKQKILDVIDGKIKHLYQGLCPDGDGIKQRDTECPACQILIEFELVYDVVGGRGGADNAKTRTENTKN